MHRTTPLQSFWGLPGGSLRESVTPFGWPRVVSDNPTLGPDTSAVLVVLSGRMVGACTLALTSFPRRYLAIWGSAKCVGQARHMCGTSRCWGRILVLFRRFQLVRGRGVGEAPTLARTAFPRRSGAIWGAPKGCPNGARMAPKGPKSSKRPPG